MSSTRQNGQSGGSDGGDITPGIFASSVAELNIHTNNSNNNENEDDDDKDQTKIIYCYTDGAMEALKVCHSEFLSLLASEIGSRTLSSATTSQGKMGKILKDTDVETYMQNIGLGHIAMKARRQIDTFDHKNGNPVEQEPQNNLQETSDKDKMTRKRSKKGTTDATSRNRKKKKRRKEHFDVTDESIEEQERLLALSAAKLRAAAAAAGASM
mmetsp:Transcript_34693/g.45989  ORF Transcript_34693/g.45989 Transcript_34693/m.45989 type:complete len:212 (+) Transcript_34693:49-684(+)